MKNLKANTSSLNISFDSNTDHSVEPGIILTSEKNYLAKTSFLILHNNKYKIVRTSDIAYFYTKHANSIIVTFTKNEFFVNYSLDRIQEMIGKAMFFRANRQFLINFTAIKEVEHYFARELLVNLIVPVEEKLIIPKEKSPAFLQWLENR